MSILLLGPFSQQKRVGDGVQASVYRFFQGCGPKTSRTCPCERRSGGAKG